MTRHAPQPAPTSAGDVGRRIVITLRLPPRELSPNGRPGWAPKARAVRRYRETAHLLALAARPGRPMERARVTAKFYFVDRRQRDPDNLLASLKSAIDGLVDAHVVGNDANMVHMPIEQYVDRANPRVEIEVQEVTDP